jgi:excisionase family DNA binding protein
MNALALDAFSERMPTDIEIGNADQLRKIMAGIIKEDEDITINVVQERGRVEAVTLTPAIAQTFLEVLRLVSSGRSFRLIAVNAELTTQQAADLLNVSRPFLIKLLEEGAVKFTKVGRHRRVRAEDLFAFKAARDQGRATALSEMAAADAEAGLI